MIEKLSNDIIHEILTRLPLKNAAQWRLLNKYFYSNISMLKLLSSIKPIIFRDPLGDRITIINSLLRTATLPNKVTIIDSCNGILFLRFDWSWKFCVFNPLTGGINLFLDHDIINSYKQYPSLAVNIPANPSSSSFDFKLVDLDIENFMNPVRSRLRFCVYHVPYRRSNLVKKYLYLDDYQGSFGIGHHRPVYAHGCLHWLGLVFTAIASFDMESERRRIIDGPLINIGPGPGPDYPTWFGLARGSLQFIRIDCNTNTMIVHSHNYFAEEWRVAHRIEKPNYMSSDSTPKNPRMVEFFDGRNVFCKILKGTSRMGINVEEIYVHDLSMGEWNKIGQVENGYGNFYMEFIPTTARVSDSYMWSKKSAQLRLTLLGLQQILLGTVGHES